MKTITLTHRQAAHIKDVLEVNLADVEDDIWESRFLTKQELIDDIKDAINQLSS